MERIREVRARYGISKAELARQAGIDAGVLCRIELGCTDPQVRTVRKSHLLWASNTSSS